MFWNSSRTWIKLTLAILLFIIPCNLYAGITDTLPIDKFTDKYDIYFRKGSKKFFGVGFDQKQFKSQGMAESRLTPTAMSHVGAKGIMQLMDFTWKEVAGEDKDVYDPKWNIPSGIEYDYKLYKQQSSKRPFNDRMALTFASYNAGLGNPLKAQKICIKENGTRVDCNLQANIIKYGDQVKTQINEETDTYVKRIFSYMNIVDNNSENIVNVIKTDEVKVDETKNIIEVESKNNKQYSIILRQFK